MDVTFETETGIETEIKLIREHTGAQDGACRRKVEYVRYVTGVYLSLFSAPPCTIENSNWHFESATKLINETVLKSDTKISLHRRRHTSPRRQADIKL